METTSGASAFCTDAEVDRHLNDGLASLYNLLIGARGEDYYANTQVIALLTGTQRYDLDAAFFQLIGVQLYDGSNFYNPKAWNWKETAQLNAMSASNSASSVNTYYRITGRSRPDPALYNDTITILPPPKTGWTLSVTYIPAAPVLTANPDTFDGVSGYEEFACLSAAIKMLTKEESDPGVLMGERAALEMRIRALAGSRDASFPEHITDTKGDWAGFGWVWTMNNWNS
tara:strand:+ start:8429 stop:9115 length:687 start_codon:yes stop_codon:yes gene_type:complete